MKRAAPKRAGAIRNLPFRHNKAPGLGVEVFRLSELFTRETEQELLTPKRPEFHIIYLGIRGKGSIVVDFTEVPFGAGLLTVTARGRVHHFLPPGPNVDAWLLL